jgi:hypothetical protein
MRLGAVQTAALLVEKLWTITQNHYNGHAHSTRGCIFQLGSDQLAAKFISDLRCQLCHGASSMTCGHYTTLCNTRTLSGWVSKHQ